MKSRKVLFAIIALCIATSAGAIVVTFKEVTPEEVTIAVEDVPPGSTVILQRSVDLETWQDVIEGDADGSGNVELSDPDPNPSQFYRVRLIEARRPGSAVQMEFTFDQEKRNVPFTTPIPRDATKPQSNEGGEYSQLNTTITPTDSSSLLLIEVEVQTHTSSGNGGYAVMALFRDDLPDALATSVEQKTGAADANTDVSVRVVRIRQIVEAGSVDPTTFKVRLGGSILTSFNVNQFNGTGYGETFVSSMTVSEIRR